MATTGQAAAKAGQQDASNDSRTRARLLQRHTALMSNVDEMEEKLLKEILGQTDEPKNWKGMVIAIAIILLVSGLIVAAIMLVMPKNKLVELGTDFAIDDVFDKRYQPVSVDLHWLPGPSPEYAYRDMDGNLRLGHAATNESSVLMSSEMLKQHSADRAILSSSKDYVLLSSETQSRRSYTKKSKYTVYNRRLRSQCTVKGGDFLQYATWIPQANSIVYVDNNDVYLMANVCQATGVKALSSGGRQPGVYNGIPDPLYEDEILKTDNAIWIAKDGSRLVYASFDDRQLPDYRMATYDRGKDEYSPVITTVHYPKAGNNSRNPMVTLRIVDLENVTEGRPLQMPQTLNDSEYYLTSAKWVDDGHFYSSWLSRNFELGVHVVCDVKAERCEEIRSSQYQNGEGHFCIGKPPIFISGGRRPSYFFLSYTKSGSDENFYKHVIKYDSSQKDSGYDITKAAYDDIAPLAYDASSGSLYYLSTGGDPRARHLFRVNANVNVDAGRTEPPECVSCQIKGCEFVEAEFHENSSFYLLSCLGPAVPMQVLRDAHNVSADVVLQDNADLAQALAKKAWPIEHIVEVRLDGHSTWARVLVPATHRPEFLLRHSLVVILPMDGPDAQPAAKKFHIGWETVLASKHVVAMVDSRGSDNHGLKFKMAVDCSPGKAEGKDAMQTARALMTNKSLGIDISKPSVVIGEGYGGFVALHAQRSGTPFNCSVVTSPVIDLGQYYTAVAERYVKTSPCKSRSYEETSVERFVGELKNAHMFLVHELADDRYHFQNTALLTRDLQLNSIQFESQISAFSQTYAGQAMDFKRYYYQKVLRFLDKCLG